MTAIRRRLPAVFMIACLLLGLVAPLAAQAREMVSTARVDVPMRTGPSARHAAKWTLSRGYPLTVTGRQGAWLRVRDFENDQGWVLRSHTGATPHHVAKASVLNIRGTPSTRGRIVGKAAYGDVLRTLERRGDWVKVRHERGTVGWVSRRLVWGW